MESLHADIPTLPIAEATRTVLEMYILNHIEIGVPNKGHKEIVLSIDNNSITLESEIDKHGALHATIFCDPSVVNTQCFKDIWELCHIHGFKSISRQLKNCSKVEA